MQKQKVQYSHWYWVMGVFVSLGVFNLWGGQYCWAASNIAIGVALGGSGVQRWEDLHLLMKTTVCGLLVASLSLFTYGALHGA